MNPIKPSDDHIAAIAIAEIESPTLAITKQFFAVHQLADEPVSYVWFEHGRGLVYLRLKGERYYWVVEIEVENETLKPVWGSPSTHAHVYAVIYSEHATAAEITGALSLQPTETKEKGAPLPGGRRTYNEHRWYYWPNIPDCLEFEMKLSHLLADLMARVKQVHALPANCHMHINVAYYEDQDWPGGWHLDSATLRQLAELGCELDIDLYTDGPSLPD